MRKLALFFGLLFYAFGLKAQTPNQVLFSTTAPVSIKPVIQNLISEEKNSVQPIEGFEPDKSDVEMDEVTVFGSCIQNSVCTAYEEATAAKDTIVYLQGYTGRVGCPLPVSAEEFINLKASLTEKSFEDTRLTTAKSVVNSHCFLVSEVKELCSLFSSEENKLAFAKLAYPHTYDVDNFITLNELFTVETSVKELEAYILLAH